jgi:glycine/D-amino acid oxidase-like deaminating enzyme
MRDYRSYSFWLETAGDDLTPRPALERSIDADVAILGAGYTGLWTAYYLLKARPALRVVILEREIAGFGASGRNGGWCSSKLNVDLDKLAARYGPAAARALQHEMHLTVDEVGRACAAEGIDARYVKGGSLFLARFPYQVRGLEDWAAMHSRLGLDDHQEILDARALARRIRVRGALAAWFCPDYASIHPGRLARGLARAVERLGATIHERTRVVEFRPASPPSRPAILRTPGGDVRAATVVLAGEAYLTTLRPLHRQLLPLYSLIVLTEPLSARQWQEIGWEGRETVASFRLTVDYLTRTDDGRILFGGRGAPYHYGSAIADGHDRDPRTHAMLRAMARDWFPCLADTRFTHAWGGPIGVPRDWTPTIAHDPATGIATARGYTGHGVATSNLAGRTLAALITGADSPLARLPLVNHRSPNWEPEPLRWLAVRYIQCAFTRLDARGERTGIPPTGRSLAERLSRY